MWVFGYGSLVWKVDFPISQRLVGHIEGFKRRFWQGSEDHRGTHDKPGRVLTLIPSDNPKEEVWGVAYLIPPECKEQVSSHLNFREKCGYRQVVTNFIPMDAGIVTFPINLYVGSESNPHFLGPAPLDEMANHIFRSRGRSGTNREYLFQLADAMRMIAPHVDDLHLFELEAAVRQLVDQEDDEELTYLKYERSDFTLQTNTELL